MSEIDYESHYKFEARVSLYLDLYTHSFKVRVPYRCYYILIFAKLSREFPLKIVLQEMLIRVLRYFKSLNRKERFGILVDSLNKGGVEQVIYEICHMSRAFSPVVFITNSGYGELGFKLVKEGFPVYLLEDSFDKFKEIVEKNKIKLINSHYSVWNLERIHNLNIPIIYTIHNTYTWINGEDRVQRISYYRFVDHFIAVSPLVKDYFSKKFKVDLEKISVIENGFYANNLNFYTDGSRSKPAEFTIINVASYTPLKNQGLLIKAFSQFHKKNCKLILAGNTLSPEYLNYLKFLVKKLNVAKSVKFTGFLGKTSLEELYKDANLLILCSLQEGAPNVLLEGLFYNLPIISTDVGNARRLLDGRGIVLSNPYKNLDNLSFDQLSSYAYNSPQKNVDDLANAITDIFVNYDYWRVRNITDRKFIAKNYSAKVMVRNYERIFSKFCRNRQIK